MQPYQEISQLYTKDFLKDYHILDKYQDIEKYYKLTPKDYFKILASDPPQHPLAKRFNKLVSYTARLIGNPNVKEIKKTLLKILKKDIFSKPRIKEDFHELLHLVLGQSIEIFLKNRIYIPEHYIYEVVVVTMESGIHEATIFLLSSLPYIINDRFIPLKKIYIAELSVFKAFADRNITYKKEIKNLWNLLQRSHYYNIFHLQKFLTLYPMSTTFPLAINFKNEILNQITKPATLYYNDYKKTLYRFTPELIDYASTPKTMKDFFQTQFKEFSLTYDNTKNLLTNIEIFPEETKQIVKKFVLYMSAVLERYPLKKT